VYRYVFNRTTGDYAELMPGASHTQEMAFLEQAGSASAGSTPEDVELSAAMAALWGDMAAAGRPATGEAGGLKPYGHEKRAAVLFQLPRANASWEVPSEVAERCARWAPFLVD
jgi:carboxylesterase type B